MRHLSTLLVLVVCTVGCQGPISDWPHSSGGDDNGSIGAGPVSNPGQPGATAGSGTQSPPPSTAVPGGSVAGTNAGTTAGTTGGTSPNGAGGTIGSAGAMDAGASGTASPDAGVLLDAGALDSGILPSDGGSDAQPDAASDAGCLTPIASDAGLCPAYGCRTQQQLRSAMNQQGACTSDHALTVACEGRVSNAALQCTQENVFSISLSRAVNTCLKRDPQLSMLSSDCLNCFVEESLCTLSRCFAACTASYGSECQACRQKQCSAPLALCTGLPAP